MSGRYGMDALNMAFIFLGLFLALINSFINSPVLAIFVLALLALELLRAFSRKIHARKRENELFIKLSSPAWKWIKTQTVRFKQRKTYRYRTCPNCKSTLRLPAKKGRHTTRCPKCGVEFRVKI